MTRNALAAVWGAEGQVPTAKSFFTNLVAVKLAAVILALLLGFALDSGQAQAREAFQFSDRNKALIKQDGIGYQPKEKWKELAEFGCERGDAVSCAIKDGRMTTYPDKDLGKARYRLCFKDKWAYLCHMQGLYNVFVNVPAAKKKKDLNMYSLSAWSQFQVGCKAGFAPSCFWFGFLSRNSSKKITNAFGSACDLGHGAACAALAEIQVTGVYSGTTYKKAINEELGLANAMKACETKAFPPNCNAMAFLAAYAAREGRLDLLDRIVAMTRGTKQDNAPFGAVLAAMEKPGRAHVVQHLIDAGVPVLLGQTIQKARKDGASDSATLVLAELRKPTPAMWNGNTPIINAAHAGDPQLVQLRKDMGDNVNTQNSSGATALAGAAQAESFDTVQLLLALGADPNTASFAEDRLGLDTTGWTALHYAAYNGHGDIINALLDAGALADARTTSGLTPLQYAAGYGRVAAMRVLLARGADPNSRSTDNVTALIQAAAASQPQAVRLLLEVGADPDVETKDDRNTALHYALQNEDQAIAGLLLDYGADTSLANAKGQTPRKIIAQQAQAERQEAARQQRIAQAQAQQKSKSGGGFLGGMIGAVAGAYLGSEMGLDASQISDMSMSLAKVGMAAETDNPSMAISSMNALEAKMGGASPSFGRGAGLSGGRVASGPLQPNLIDRVRARCAEETQVRVQCDAADAYYRRYTQLVNEGKIDPSQMYATHRAQAEVAMNMMQNFQKDIGVTIVRDSEGASSGTPTSSSGDHYSNYAPDLSGGRRPKCQASSAPNAVCEK